MCILLFVKCLSEVFLFSEMLCFRPHGYCTFCIKHGGEHVYRCRKLMYPLSLIQSLYPGPTSTWRLPQCWSSAKTSSSTAPMTMEPGLHTGGLKVGSHWPMWRGSCCHLTRSSWPSHGCWWQTMTSTAARWRILWAAWRACRSGWRSTVSDAVLVIGCSANKLNT